MTNTVYKQVAIRRSLLGNILLILCCFIFAALGIFMIQDGESFIGIALIVFFGGGGLLYLVLMARKPIAVISSKGVTVPYGWGENFVAWKNVDRFEVVEQRVGGRYKQKQKYIGIFVTDTEGLVGADEFSQKITKSATGWKEAPGLLIALSFSFVKMEKVLEILQEFHDEYRNTQNSGMTEGIKE